MAPALAALYLLAAPAHFFVQLDTSKGAILVEVHREWAPRAADRFFALVSQRYYDGSRFFRVVKGQWAQFGIAGRPQVAQRWRQRTFPDDEQRVLSNVRGTVAFAFARPGGRSTQVFINLRDNALLDAEGFVPFGRVVQGMDVVDALNSKYGEASGGGMRGGKQDRLFEEGNAYLDREFPRLDKLHRARIIARRAP